MIDPEMAAFELLVAEPDDELARLLFELRWLVLKHPIAAQATYRALIEEGRRFGVTAEGRSWRERLEGSALIRRGKAIWELGTLGMLDGDTDRILPTQLIDAFARAAGRRDLEEALARRLEPDPELVEDHEP
jgi:hypothetical protein